MVSSSFGIAAENEQTQIPSVSIIMPALNEEKTIGKVVSETAGLMRSKGLSFEILVVDDGSTDGTFGEALQCGAAVMSNGANRGKG